MQVLTKRAQRMAAVANADKIKAADHIWLGVSVEDRRYGLPRIDWLRNTPAGRRFLSIEPLLEDLGSIDLRDIDWVIVGGESGPGARPMHPDWARALRDQCREQDVPFFFKQWGGVRKKQHGRILDGRTHEEMPLWVAPRRIKADREKALLFWRASEEGAPRWSTR